MLVQNPDKTLIFVKLLGPKSGLILGLRPANETQCYFVTTALTGWVQT